MNLDQFIEEHAGQYNVGDTPENMGQCVGLVEVYTDELGETHTWGNAKDLCYNADRHSFDVTFNSPNAVPQRGDIFCFDGNLGAGLGHTGIVTSADLNSVTLFEQNDPWGTRPHLKTYSYDHAIGWIHPKVLDNQGANMIPDANHLNALFVAFLGRPASDVEISQYVGTDYSKMVETLNDNNAERDALLKIIEAGRNQSTVLSPGVYRVN